eukprot:3592539-Rhodomonas_salina.1
MGECGTEQTRMALKAAGAYDAVLRASASNEPNIRRATTLAMAGLRGGAPMSLPPLDEDLEDRRSLATPKPLERFGGGDQVSRRAVSAARMLRLSLA